jgi:uncharacterized protein (DUF111 family)
VKLARLGGDVVNVSVEYDDVAAAAAHLRLPVKVVLARASAAAQQLTSDPDSDVTEEGQ